MKRTEMIRRLQCGALACSLAGSLACSGTADAEADETAQADEVTCPVEGVTSGPTESLGEGDNLVQVDGAELSTPERATEAYARLRAAAKCAQQRDESEEPVVVDFDIE